MSEQAQFEHTILIVNDEIGAITLIGILLERSGWKKENILKARSEKETLMILRDHLPDLIIMDDRMPEIDGIDLIRLIRKDSRFTDTTILLTTAFPSYLNKDELNELNVQDLIIIPILNANLPQIVGKHLGVEATYKPFDKKI